MPVGHGKEVKADGCGPAGGGGGRGNRFFGGARSREMSTAGVEGGGQRREEMKWKGGRGGDTEEKDGVEEICEDCARGIFISPLCGVVL